jgi:hypothetical protein
MREELRTWSDPDLSHRNRTRIYLVKSGSGSALDLVLDLFMNPVPDLVLDPVLDLFQKPEQ